MRTYVTAAAIAVTAAACGTAAVPEARTATVNIAANAGVDGPEAPDGATRRIVVPAPKPPAAKPKPKPAHDHSTHVHAKPAPKKPAFDPTKPRKTPRYVDYGRWHTPEAAMRYLARAYTNHDEVSLRHVTNPAARAALLSMRDYAPDLRLVSCVDSGWGSYTCTFSHAIKNSTKRGSATLEANPALKPGWYATALTDCGD